MNMNRPEGTAADHDLEQLSGLFRLLSDRTRLNILMALALGERNVSSLCQELGLPQPTVSHHLGLLRTNNIISNRRRGKQVFYTLSGSVSMYGGLALETSVENFSVRIAHKAPQGYEGIARTATG